jgi:hypothetical protein
MPKQYDSMFESVCEKCKRKIEMTDVIRTHGMEIYHEQCWKNKFEPQTSKTISTQSGIDPDELRKMTTGVGKIQMRVPIDTNTLLYNKPEHYHQHDIDTIEFLKRGFPPQVLTGFLIGNIIKYTQRFEYKNGEEDVLKIVDYAKRLQEWYKETHSS